MLAIGNLNVLGNRECGEKRAILKEYAPTLLMEASFFFGKRREVDTEYTNPAGIRLFKAEYGPQQDGLALTRPADNDYHPAAPGRALEGIMHDRFAKASVDPLHLDEKR